LGNVHVHRNKAMAVLVLALLVALAVFSALLVAQNANAQATFTTCEACHSMATTHSSGNANHTGIACATCHNNGGTANPPLPTACGGCHGGVSAILATSQHTTNGCGTTVGCHGFTGVTQVTTVLTAKAAPTTVKVGKQVTISGTATPAAQLAGAKIAILVNRKVGTKWVKAKAATATASATGAYSWKYKVAKKGSYQVKVSVNATTAFTAKSVTKTFKAK
jgi:hypothetical protein